MSLEDPWDIFIIFWFHSGTYSTICFHCPELINQYFFLNNKESTVYQKVTIPTKTTSSRLSLVGVTCTKKSNWHPYVLKQNTPNLGFLIRSKKIFLLSTGLKDDVKMSSALLYGLRM